MSERALSSPPASDVSDRDLANAIRALSMDAVQHAQSGHPGMPMGAADMATALFRDHLVFDANTPDWPNRDRFILSAGHGSMLLYSLLYLTGYGDITLEEIKQFRQLGAKTAGHPEYGHAAGIETTTGPLGQGIANSVGFALAERILAAQFGDTAVDHYTYVIAGDGCLMEGISQEAISLAGHLKLHKLIVLWDDNEISIDGPTSLSTSDDQVARFKASRWDVQSVDGHDIDAVSAAIAHAKTTDTPSLIACKTTIGYGSPNKAGTSGSHGAPLGDEEIIGTREALAWPHGAFEIPDSILNAWRSIGQRGSEARSAWDSTIAALDSDLQQEFKRRVIEERLPDNLPTTMQTYKETLVADAPKWATRKASGAALEVLTAAVPELIGGSADLTGSNLTKTDALSPIQAGSYSGRYVYYGIREHAMAAAMNGMALHGGIIPYGGTFMVFTDYCRPAIRLSALMGIRSIYVMTHDSIGLGEDGPTHQPVEHLASLRAMPNVNVYRPADAVETAECWELALATKHTPSVLSLTRQGVPTVRSDCSENLCAKGAYILSEAEGDVSVTIFASGSEVELALNAQSQLQHNGIGVRVVSVPCVELFDQQESDYKVGLLCNSSLKVAVEAASSYGWHRYIGPHGIFVGMEGFGASAPASDLYQHFGITVEAIVKRVKAKLDNQV